MGYEWRRDVMLVPWRGKSPSMLMSFGVHHCQAAPIWNDWDDPHWNIYVRKSKRRGHDVKTFFPPGRSRKKYIIFLGAFWRAETMKVALSSTNLPLASSDSRLETVNLCDEGFFEVTFKKRSRIWSYMRYKRECSRTMFLIYHLESTWTFQFGC